MSAPQVWMKEIASRAGVSLMTVSRALRNQPTVAEATRTRIQKLAEEMGYRPNPMVSTLMAQIRGSRPSSDICTVCFITAYPGVDHWKDLPINVHTLKGAQARGNQLGYRVDHFPLTEPGMTDLRASNILRSRGVAGLILAPLPEPTPVINLKWEWFACATVGYSMKTPVLHRAVNDQMATIMTVYRSLRDLGYRHIGLAIQLHDDERVNRKWVAGFSAEQMYTLPAERVPILLANAWNREVFTKWFRKNKPDAVICLNPIVKKWLEQEGFAVPQEIGVACLHRTDSDLTLSGVDQHYEHVGALALDLVVEQIHKNERGLPEFPKVVMAGGEWIAGNSTIHHPVKQPV